MKNNVKDITGKTYNYLTALERLPTFMKGKRRVTLWRFSCICGEEKIAESSDVKSGGIKSCGCKTKELMSKAKSKPDGVAASNHLYYSYKERCAKDRGYEFKLTKEEFVKITSKNCYYCNKQPSQIKKSKNSFYIYNGIDRVNNQYGYIKGNIVPCCQSCNSLKSGITKEMVIALYNWFKENE